MLGLIGADCSAVRLERGITTDTEFEQWANMAWYYPNASADGDEMPLASFRREIQAP